MYKIFDAHCHIYPADIAPRAVAGVDTFYEGLPVEPRDGTVDTLVEYTEKLLNGEQVIYADRG